MSMQPYRVSLLIISLTCLGKKDEWSTEGSNGAQERTLEHDMGTPLGSIATLGGPIHEVELGNVENT